MAFAKFASENPDMTFGQLEKALSIGAAPDRALSFDPTSVRYFKEVADRLSLTSEEKAIFKAKGMVSIDHVQRYSMASAYHAIYTRDLPLLVTTDSILHALHRSYDDVLKGLEVRLFTQTIQQTLEATRGALHRSAMTYRDDRLRESAGDIDVYLTVALNLLAAAETPGASLPFRSKLVGDARVEELLKNIASLEMRPTPLWGTTVGVDFSQFKPRGHYTESEELKRYFRTLMWLGRADLGFTIAPNDDSTEASAQTDRGLRDAALLALMVKESGTQAQLDAMSGAIDFLVGRSDNLRLDQLEDALAKQRINDPNKLADPKALAALRAAVAGLGAQQIRSQALVATEEPKETMPPSAFQLFGQRFLLDSFVLSHVVFDSIVYRGGKPDRQMPSGRDVMAALGNDEAVRLLKPELDRFNYSTNLFAARKVVETYPKEEWSRNVYSLWLDALRTLDDVPNGEHLPEVMRRQAWRRKHLETQLASWAELRHDTILYGKQSYSSLACEYPEGYVEPYPEFYARLRELADTFGDKLGKIGLPSGQLRQSEAASLRDGYVKHFRGFGETMQFLELLARKELAAKPFTAEEVGFLKKTVDIQGGGSGPPRYDGWYPRLIFGARPMEHKPTVADVHTAPGTGGVLEEGVGDVNFLIVAVDNEKDRAVYVGPAYSYYEFTSSMENRLTDEQWSQQIEQGSLPERPKWTAAFRGKPLRRTLPAITRSPTETDPRAKTALEQFLKRTKTGNPMDRGRIYDELMEATRHPPLPAPAKRK